MNLSQGIKNSEPQEDVEEELQVFPISMSVTVSMLRLIFDGKKQDNNDEEEVKYVDGEK